MIKTPVHASTELDDDDNIVQTGEIYDDDGNSVCDTDVEFVSEIAKRINLHSCLVEALKYSVDFMEDRAATKYDLNKVSEFRKLLEQCNYDTARRV